MSVRDLCPLYLRSKRVFVQGASRVGSAHPWSRRARVQRRVLIWDVAFVYVLRCADGSLYTGAALDVAARVRRHQSGRASRYTRARLPVRLVWHCERATWGEALREEHRIKKLRRSDKLRLIRARRRANR